MTKAAELAKIVDASGNVVTSGTVEPAGDTAAGDNAAIGFTSAEGIVITGQGSTNDVTIKNDADADVIEIPTGTTNVTVAGTLTATGFIIGSADINENDLESIDGITAGTIAASKAAIVDTNKDITGFRNITLTGELDAATLDVSGDADIDGTLEADAITVNGTALATVIAGTTVTTATNANHVSVADNESTNEENLIPFIEDASATGNVGLESDGDFAYNPSTGTVSATVFKGNIDAVDGDFDGTLEADAITIGGTAIASVLSPVAGSSSIVTTGALNSGSITSGFGTIDTGSSTITTTGLGTFGTLAVNGATTITTADNNPQLILKSTDADANGGPLLDLMRDSSSPADNDAMGSIRFRGDDDAGNETQYVDVTAYAPDVSDGSEDGQLQFRSVVGGTLRNRFDINPTEVVFNEDSVDVDFRVESNGQANMLFVDGGNDKIGIGLNSPSTSLHIRSSVASNIAGYRDGTTGLIVEGDAASYIQLVASKTNPMAILFDGGDTHNDTARGGIIYDIDTGLSFKSGGSTRWTINETGNLLPSATSLGIHLGVTSATASNLLDDYEEGTFTPSAEGSTTAGTVSHTSSPVGRYTKVGRDVTIFMQLNFTLSGEAGVLRITGLPFACSTSQESVGSFQCNNMENSYGSNVAHYNSVIQGGESHVHFRGTTSDGSNYHSMAANNMTYIRVSITYPTG
jgi:prepilin-type processing-associated H-X9-DG protein